MPGYDRKFAVSQASLRSRGSLAVGGEDAIGGAAEALREVEVEAAQSASVAGAVPDANARELDTMSIDDLRDLAASLEVPNLPRIVDRDELAEAVRARL